MMRSRMATGLAAMLAMTAVVPGGTTVVPGGTTVVGGPGSYAGGYISDGVGGTIRRGWYGHNAFFAGGYGYGGYGGYGYGGTSYKTARSTTTSTAAR